MELYKNKYICIYTHTSIELSMTLNLETVFSFTLWGFSPVCSYKSQFTTVGTIPLLENWAMWLSIETLLAQEPVVSMRSGLLSRRKSVQPLMEVLMDLGMWPEAVPRGQSFSEKWKPLLTITVLAYCLQNPAPGHTDTLVSLWIPHSKATNFPSLLFRLAFLPPLFDRFQKVSPGQEPRASRFKHGHFRCCILFFSPVPHYPH